MKLGLVLTRTKGQQVIIGEGENKVVVTVARIGKDSVRLGIKAIGAIPIHRAEIYALIQGEKSNDTTGTEADRSEAHEVLSGRSEES